MGKGLFIVVDGGEGAGKGTQIKRALEYYKDRDIVLTREPGGSLFGEEVRKLMFEVAPKFKAHENPKTTMGLVFGARADHIERIIAPAIAGGKIVICDRFDSSTFGYQVFGSEALELANLFWHMRHIYLGDCAPDLYIHFKIDPEAGLARKQAQKGGDKNYMDDKKVDFHRRVAQGYQVFFDRIEEEGTAVEIIDASQSLEGVWHDFSLVLRDYIG